MVTQRNLSDAVSKSLVASAAQWRSLGLTTAQFRSAVRSGDLVRVWYGVYATKRAVAWGKTSPLTEHALRVLAVRTVAGRDMAASHHTAAILHGLALYPEAPDLVALTRPPGNRSNRQKAGLIIHSAELPTGHTAKRQGVPVTTVARTVVDIARNSSFMSGVVTADNALNRELTTKQAMVAVCDSCDRWPGVRKAREVISFADPLAGSVLESCARVMFRQHGLEPPQLQVNIRGDDFSYLVDFFWPRYDVIAETDGAVKYADPKLAIKQLKRDQKLRDAGYTVIHFTWAELFGSTTVVIARIRRACGLPQAV
jgi:very-short-patch-repair endonuclease